MKFILVILVLVLVLFALVLIIRLVLVVVVLVILCHLSCRFKDVIIAIGRVVRLSSRRLLQALAETVLVRVVLVGISVAHLGQQQRQLPRPEKE